MLRIIVSPLALFAVLLATACATSNDAPDRIAAPEEGPLAVLGVPLAALEHDPSARETFVERCTPAQQAILREDGEHAQAMDAKFMRVDYDAVPATICTRLLAGYRGGWLDARTMLLAMQGQQDLDPPRLLAILNALRSGPDRSFDIAEHDDASAQAALMSMVRNSQIDTTPKERAAIAAECTTDLLGSDADLTMFGTMDGVTFGSSEQELASAACDRVVELILSGAMSEELVQHLASGERDIAKDEELLALILGLEA